MTQTDSSLAFPKPVPRVRDKKAWKRYHQQFPWCQVQGCRHRAMPEPHHIHSNGTGGPGDVVSNAISLCWDHHVGPLGPHSIGHVRWFNLFQSRLSDELREKVRHALHLNAEVGQSTTND